jgi:arginine/lysine/ornithine decarboxylase
MELVLMLKFYISLVCGENKMIIDALEKYIKKNGLRMHMPGHKGKMENDSSPFAGIYPYDVTEIAGMDDLHHPEGIIQEAQARAKELYQSKESFFLVNGASCGIEASFLALTHDKTEVLLPRFVHQSVFNGLILSGAKPVYIPSNFTKNGMPLPLCPDQLEQAIREHPDVRYLCFMTPNYEGIAPDLRAIKEITQKREITTIVDEAHGAHFLFHPELPTSAQAVGFDVVIHGSHKTLGSLTQTAMLHLNQLKYKNKLRSALQITQSTSPSYVLLASLDLAREYMEIKGKILYNEMIDKLKLVRKEINQLHTFTCLEEVHLEEEGLTDYHIDLTKLIIAHEKIDGFTLSERLRERAIEVEMATEAYVVLICTIYDDFSQYGRIVEVLRQIDHIYQKDIGLIRGYTQNLNIQPMVYMTPREAYFAEKEQVKWEDSIGRVAGQFIIPYPPGIPILTPGEAIMKEHVMSIKEAIKNKRHLQGFLAENTEYMVVIKED